MTNFLYKRTRQEREISNNAHQLGLIFNIDSDADEFLNRVISEFDSFEKLVDISTQETFSNDVVYITQCATESLTSPPYDKRFQNRVDAYFYICDKIEDYYDKKKKEWDRFYGPNDEADMTQLKIQFLERLADTFKSTKGTEPTLCTNDPRLIKSFDIPKYLSFITTIDNQTLYRFFAVYKLLLQSSSTCYQDDLQWKNILSQKQFDISLAEFVACYKDYKEVFQDFPLNIDTFISLIQKIHPHKKDQTSYLLPYHALVKELSLGQNEFFESFQNIFVKGVSNNCYDCEEVAHFLWIVGVDGSFFKHYLAYYYRSLVGCKDDIWKIFFHINEKWQINDVIQQNLPRQIIIHVSTISTNKFLSDIAECTKHSANIKPENRAYYETMVETIFEEYIKDLLGRKKASDRLSDIDLKRLLKTSVELPKNHEIFQSSSSLIIRRLLFQTKNPASNAVDHIQTLFNDLREFDQDPYRTYAPANMIRDEWFRDVLGKFPEEFCTWLTHHTYRDLCENYKNNPWAHFIWSRIMHFSILKSKFQKSSSVLLKLNQWMFDVGHHIFHIDDELTIIIIKHLFEIILKDDESVLSLPDIPYILDFIFNIRDTKIVGTNMQDLDAFFERGQHTIQDILVLKGKLNLRRATFKVISWMDRNYT